VLSEELGDGDLSKHHVHLYEQLLEAVGQHLPKGHSADFIKPSHWGGMENRDEWVAAAGQLLISLFPDEFLPEILGFNMHYELITMDTLRANHELKALKINPYYFLIHIVIDNADSGHTAIAIQVVTRYLDMIREKEGEAAVEGAWKRVQVGYATRILRLRGKSSYPRTIRSTLSVPASWTFSRPRRQYRLNFTAKAGCVLEARLLPTGWLRARGHLRTLDEDYNSSPN